MPTPRLCALLLVAMVGSAPLAASANDGVFGGNGVHPMPISTSDVRMVDEIVKLRLDPKAKAWNVDCSFIFENTSDQTVTLTVGFPFPTYFADGGDVATPAEVREPKPNEPLVWDFKTFVRGKAVRAKRSKTEVNPAIRAQEYEFAYLWDVTFAPGEQVHIRNTYRHGISEVVGGLTYAHYVLRTGGLWKTGKIGHARLSVQVPGHRMTLCPKELAGEAPISIPGLVVSPLHDEPGLEVHGSLHEFEPKQDLSICFQNLDAYAQMQFYTGLEGDDYAGKSADELRLARNTVYALHGYTFKDPKLQAHFAQQWWYRPNPDFGPKKLSQEERDFIARIKALEDKAKRAK